MIKLRILISVKIHGSLSCPDWKCLTYLLQISIILKIHINMIKIDRLKYLDFQFIIKS
jgi:hypothetical protein